MTLKKSVPLWIKISYTLMVAVIVPIYVWKYGWTNLLWFSDIAMIVMVPALLWENRLLSSMMAISVLLLEIIWMLGFFSGGYLFNIADYMFDETLPLWLRALSLFHFPMPAAILYMLWKYGYDPRALKYQMAAAAVILPVTRAFMPEGKNINWVMPPDGIPDMPVALYIAGMLIILYGVVYVPSHYLYKRFFPVR